MQASLDKAQGELAQTARRLNDTEKTLRRDPGPAQDRRRRASRTRRPSAPGSSAALDEANHKHLDDDEPAELPLRGAAGPRQA